MTPVGLLSPKVFELMVVARSNRLHGHARSIHARLGHGKRGTRNGTFHLCCECTHPIALAKRGAQALQSTLPTLLEHLTSLVCKALRAGQRLRDL